MSAARTLIAAVTGHRLDQLQDAEQPRIAAEIARALDGAQRAARAANGGRTPHCTLYSAIAEGADRYAAVAALERGWRLVTPLPYSVDRYAEEFRTQESKDEYRRLLWSSRRVIPAVDDRKDSAKGAPYVAVGRVLIEKADVLLCIWNGRPPKGPGGTSEVAALMLEKGGLVLWIPAQEGPTRLIAPTPAPRVGSFRRKLFDGLSQWFDQAARPAEMRVA